MARLHTLECGWQAHKQLEFYMLAKGIDAWVHMLHLHAHVQLQDETPHSWCAWAQAIEH